jgi:shikimate kinase
MNEQKKIILIGLPGSGKSTLGRAVADALQLSFFDLDELIEESSGISISEIFKRQGEEAFRKLEREILEYTLSLPQGMVLATGGGAPCFYDNMDLINASGKSIFLDPPLDVLLARVENSKNRPMFFNLDKNEMIQKLETLYGKRLPYYNKAHLRIGKAVTPSNLLEILESSEG